MADDMLYYPCDEFKVGRVCGRDEVLTAIIINEDEAWASSVMRGQVELADDRSPSRRRSPRKPRIVRSVYHPKISSNGEHSGEEVWGNGVTCAFPLTPATIHYNTVLYGK